VDVNEAREKRHSYQYEPDLTWSKYVDQWLLLGLSHTATLKVMYRPISLDRRHMRAISERFRDKELMIKRYINSPSLLYFYFTLQEL